MRINSNVDWTAKFTHTMHRRVDLLEPNAAQDVLACVIIDLGHSTIRNERRQNRFLDNPISGTAAYWGRTALRNYEGIGCIKSDPNQRVAAENGEETSSERELSKFLEPRDDGESAMLVAR